MLQMIRLLNKIYMKALMGVTEASTGAMEAILEVETLGAISKLV